MKAAVCAWFGERSGREGKITLEVLRASPGYLSISCDDPATAVMFRETEDVGPTARSVFYARCLRGDEVITCHDHELESTARDLVKAVMAHEAQAERMARCAPPRPPVDLRQPWTRGTATKHLATAAGVAVNLCQVCLGGGRVYVGALGPNGETRADGWQRCVGCKGTGEAGGVVTGAEVTCKHCGRYLREHDGVKELCVPFNSETFAVDMEQVLEAAVPAVRPAPAAVDDARRLRSKYGIDAAAAMNEAVAQRYRSAPDVRVASAADLDHVSPVAQRVVEQIFESEPTAAAPVNASERPQEQADALEAAYWRFDSLCRRHQDAMTERDAFKAVARELIHRTMRQEICWTEPDVPTAPTPPDPAREGYELRKVPERWPGQAIVMPPGSVDRELHDLADVLDRTHRGGLSLSMSTRGGATLQLAYMTPEQAKEQHERAMAAIQPDPCCANCGEAEEEHGPLGACLVSCGETFEPNTIERKVDHLSDRLTALEGTVTGWPHSDHGMQGDLAEARRRIEALEKLHGSDVAALVRDLACRVRDAQALSDRLDVVERRTAAAGVDLAHERIDTVEAQIDDANGIEARLAKLEEAIAGAPGRPSMLRGDTPMTSDGIEARLATLETDLREAIPDTVATRLLKIQAAAIDDQQTTIENHAVTLRELADMVNGIPELDQRLTRLAAAVAGIVPPKRIRIALVGETGRKPERMSKHAAGLDCWSANTCARQVAVGQRWRVPLGFKIEIPVGWFGAVVGRSGGFERDGLLVHFGVVDSDYRGEVHALFQNNGREGFTIPPAYRIAQLLILPVAMLDLVVAGALSDTERGERGFGHTGDR